MSQISAFFASAKKYVVDILSIVIAVLFGWLYIQEKEKDIAEAKAGNAKDQAKINAIDQSESKTDEANNAEVDKQTALTQQLEQEQNDEPDEATILRVINSHDTDPKSS